MKKLKLVSISIFSILLFLLSCSNDDEQNNSPQEETYFLTAKIDGVDFIADASSLVSFGADGTGFYNIKGNRSNGDFITITLVSPTSTGTFIMSNNINNSAPRSNFSIPSGENWSTHVLRGTEILGSGEAIVTTNNDTYMEGTFSFTGFNPLDNFSVKLITEGKFKARKL